MAKSQLNILDKQPYISRQHNSGELNNGQFYKALWFPKSSRRQFSILPFDQIKYDSNKKESLTLTVISELIYKAKTSKNKHRVLSFLYKKISLEKI